MNRHKKKDTLLLGAPLPLPYRVENTKSRNSTARLVSGPSSYDTSYENEGAASSSQPFKRIFLGRLRNSSRQHDDEAIYTSEGHPSGDSGDSSERTRVSSVVHRQTLLQRDVESDLEQTPKNARNSTKTPFQSRSHAETEPIAPNGRIGAFQYNNGRDIRGSVDTGQRGFKFAEFTSKLHRIHTKLDIIEDSFKDVSLEENSSDIERRLQAVIDELDELSSIWSRSSMNSTTETQSFDSDEADLLESNAAYVPQENGVNTARHLEKSVFEELDRVRQQTQQKKLELENRLQVRKQLSLQKVWSTHKTTVAMVVGILFVFFSTSYYVSSLTYEYCYYYC